MELNLHAKKCQVVFKFKSSYIHLVNGFGFGYKILPSKTRFYTRPHAQEIKTSHFHLVLTSHKCSTIRFLATQSSVGVFRSAVDISHAVGWQYTCARCVGRAGPTYYRGRVCGCLHRCINDSLQLLLGDEIMD